MSRSVAVSQRMSSYLEHTQMYTQTPILLHPRNSWSLSMFTISNLSKLKPIKNRCFLSNIQSPTSRNLFVTCIWWMEETNRWNCFFRVSNFSCSCFSLSSSCPSSSLFICTDVKSLSSLLMWFHGFISKKFVLLQLFFSLPSPSSFFVMLRTLRSGYLTVSRRVVEESRSGWDWITWEVTMNPPKWEDSNEMLSCSFQSFPIEGDIYWVRNSNGSGKKRVHRPAGRFWSRCDFRWPSQARYWIFWMVMSLENKYQMWLLPTLQCQWVIGVFLSAVAFLFKVVINWEHHFKRIF